MEKEEEEGGVVARVDCVGMNKNKREENFAFGTTDQSNSRRNALLMRAIQGKKGGRQEWKRGRVWHSIPAQKIKR